MDHNAPLQHLSNSPLHSFLVNKTLLLFIMLISIVKLNDVHPNNMHQLLFLYNIWLGLQQKLRKKLFIIEK